MSGPRCAVEGCPEPAVAPYREVTGWEEVRTAGGLNRLLLRRETGRRICTTHAADLRNGVEPGHPRLL